MEKHLTVDRGTASRINPLIARTWTEDTLDTLAMVVYELGFMVSATELPRDHMIHVFEALSSALEWESANIDSCRIARETKEASHV